MVESRWSSVQTLSVAPIQSLPLPTLFNSTQLLTFPQTFTFPTLFNSTQHFHFSTNFPQLHNFSLPPLYNSFPVLSIVFSIGTFLSFHFAPYSVSSVHPLCPLCHCPPTLRITHLPITHCAHITHYTFCPPTHPSHYIFPLSFTEKPRCSLNPEKSLLGPWLVWDRWGRPSKNSSNAHSTKERETPD